MNKYTLIGLYSLFFLSNSYAQESFLQLDSIVVIDSEILLTSTGSNYYSLTYEGIDTAYLNVGINQIAILRSAAMSITGPTAQSTLFYNSDGRIYDSRITLNDFNIFTSLHLVPPNGFQEFKGSYNTNQFNTRGFSGLCKNEMILTPGQHEIIGYFKAYKVNPQVIYRIELVYYTNQ